MAGYSQFCPVALGAELFAERWTPLILRELLLGSRRFSELHNGLPRISRNLLVQRLAWRPITAIQQADVKTNPDTTPDPTWTPLITTPAFQEYPAGHPGVSNAAASVLATIYGDDTAFTATSFGLPGVERSFTSFSSAVAQVENARVWGGINFRFATLAAARIGDQVADYVTSTQLLPVDPDQTAEPNRGDI